mmetsp:Transcript_62918/g.148138  ORF Transcript_62918/g.148138 Transcript_62918/m.148138 type:complete len:433 (-) Transcript_62918:40-1338(-)
MSWAACCSNKQMQDMFFGESSGAMFRDAAKGRREAACQWCYETVQMLVVGKSLMWICDNCKGVCEACEKCGQPVRQGLVRKDNYKTCSLCFFKNFKKMEKVKVEYITAGRPMMALTKELERVSDFREQAAKAGLLRPFLLLVALPPVSRLQMAITLGWTFIGGSEMGDAHSEAWELLSRRSIGLRDRMVRMRDTLLRRETNWHSILLPLCEDLCVPAYMNWSEEFTSEKMSYADALKECHKQSAPNISSLETEFVDKIGKHQRARMSSLQACSLAELKNSDSLRKLLALPALQGQGVQGLLSYCIDSSFLQLARRDGSDGTGAVDADDLVHEVVSLLSGVYQGEAALFEEAIMHTAPKVCRDGVVMERDEAPHGSILNANIGGFWLTIDLLDIDTTTPAGKLLPCVLQILFQKGRLALHGIKIEDFMKGDFD